jgi:hypothetical protein
MVANTQEEFPGLHGRNNFSFWILLSDDDGIFSTLFVHSSLFSNTICIGTIILFDGIMDNSIIRSGVSRSDAVIRRDAST